MKSVLIFGSSGFIGFNLAKKISGNFQVSYVDRNSLNEFLKKNYEFDVVIYCAGVNRGTTQEITEGNEALLKKIIRILNFKKIIYLSSSLVNNLENKHQNYIRSKLECERILKGISNKEIIILRLPNVFGIWSKPNYNCFLHTLAYKIARDLPYEMHNQNEVIEFLYVDDLVRSINLNINNDLSEINYKTTKIQLGELESKLKDIRDGLKNNNLTCIQSLFDSQLYVTYLYHSRPVVSVCNNIYRDMRGEFIELMKINSTQISLIVCNPGFVRGNHYHHKKVEHFLLLEGEIKFIETNVKSSETEITFMSSENIEWITTRPGINHSIVNDGNVKAKILCIANEIFDKNNPDTYTTT